MKNFLLIVIVFTVLLVSEVWSVTPVITDWSSTGGTTQNKLNAQDIMYLVTVNDDLTFSATVDQAVDYEWQVNKSTAASVNANTFNWTVPNEKGIWEIHLKCWNASSEEAHKEWVVSTLSSAEAPDVFDYFSDGYYESRVYKDPWERSLPIWTVESGTIDASRKYLLPTSLQNYHANLSIPTNITKGTWIFRYKYINGTTPSWVSGNYYLTGVMAQYLNPTDKTGYDVLYKGLFLDNPPDGHWWVGSGYVKPRFYYSGYICNMIGSQIYQGAALRDKVAGTGWHEVVFIKDENEYVYSFLDGEYVRWSTDKVDDMSSNRFLLDFLDVDLSDPELAYPVIVDGIQIYKDRYLPPTHTIYYDGLKNSIIVKGIGNDLVKIAANISSAYFEYDPATNTAICKTDLTLEYGAELIISNGTLKMDCASDGQRKIKYYTDAKFRITNSLITTTGNAYFSWVRMSDIPRFAASSDACFKNTFKVINSTIDNCSKLVFERPVCFYVENSKFTNLIDRVELYFRWPLKEFKIEGCLFSGKSGNDVIIYLVGGDQFNELTPKPAGIDIINCEFVNVKFARQSDGTYYLSPETPGGTANLINCKLDQVLFSGTNLRYKYYLDVKVVDLNGDPVSGANIDILNENDDINYPAENLVQNMEYFQLQNQLTPIGNPYFQGQTTNWIKGWADINDHRAAVTTATGFTPSFSDEINTIVITDKISNDTGNSFFTHKITAFKDGKTTSTSGFDIDETWYREDAGKPVKTLVMVLDGTPYVTTDPENPNVYIISPQNGTKVFGMAMIKVNASDNYGVTKVEFYIDDVLMYVDTEGPYEWIWDTKEASEGEHSLKVIAYDTNGNRAQQSIIIKVIKAEGIVIYPNPYVKGKSISEKITFANLSKQAIIRIYNLSGELVKTIKHKNTSDGGSQDWYISGIPSGVYMYYIDSSSGNKKGKISIVK